MTAVKSTVDSPAYRTTVVKTIVVTMLLVAICSAVHDEVIIHIRLQREPKVNPAAIMNRKMARMIMMRTESSRLMIHPPRNALSAYPIMKMAVVSPAPMAAWEMATSGACRM